MRNISNGSQRLSSESVANQLSEEKTINESMAEMPNPLTKADFFGVHKLFTVRDLFESRAHLGHKSGTLNHHMTPYIFGTRLGIIIFDLDQTAQRLREALNFTAHIAFRGGVVLFVNRSRHVSSHSLNSLFNETLFQSIDRTFGGENSQRVRRVFPLS